MALNDEGLREANEEEFDNVVTALARLVVAHHQALNLAATASGGNSEDAPSVETLMHRWLDCLPLTADSEYSKENSNLLCSFIERFVVFALPRLLACLCCEQQ